jgi:hypothetical protein
MGRLKNAALAQAEVKKTSRTIVKGETFDDPTDSRRPKVIRPPATSKTERTPDRFTYALKPHTAERRSDGWWVCKTPVTSFGEKAQWTGPFASIEDACLAIAGLQATEAAERHARNLRFYGLQPGHPLHGLKPATRFKPKKVTPGHTL